MSNFAGWSNEIKSEICPLCLAVWRLLEVVMVEEQKPGWADSQEEGRRDIGDSGYKELLKGHLS